MAAYKNGKLSRSELEASNKWVHKRASFSIPIEGDTEKSKDAEASEPQKLPYPRAVFFIISTEFCERFSFYGMKSKRHLFRKNQLATKINTLAYFELSKQSLSS